MNLMKLKSTVEIGSELSAICNNPAPHIVFPTLKEWWKMEPKVMNLMNLADFYRGDPQIRECLFVHLKERRGDGIVVSVGPGMM